MFGMRKDTDDGPEPVQWDHTVDPAEVFLGDNTPEAHIPQHPVTMFEGVDGAQGSPAHSGLRTNSGEVDLLLNMVEKAVGKVFHHEWNKRENSLLAEITKGLTPERHVVTREIGAGAFNGGYVAVSNTNPQKVVDARTNRRQLILVNGSAKGFWISKFSSVNGGDAYLSAGQTLILNVTCEVWALASDNTLPILNWFETWDND